MASITTDAIVQKKEHFDDMVYRMAREETSFVSSVKTQAETRESYNWLEDSLRAPVAVAAAEGGDWVDGTTDQPVVRNNVCQIFRDAFTVSATSEVVAKYGRDKESTRLALKRALELRISLEFACVGTKQVKDDTTTTRVMAGVQAQIDATHVFLTGGASTPIDEAHLLNAMQSVSKAGGTPKVVSVTPDDAITIANFAYATGRYRNTETGTPGDKSIVNVVELYASPFYSNTKIQINWRQAAGDVIVYNPDLFKVRALRAWSRKVLPETSDGVRIGIVGEYGLSHQNFKGAAIVRRG